MTRFSVWWTESYYFSHGAAPQYKYRNLWFLKDDSGIDARWHFSAMRHNKCTWNGIWGKIKRIVVKNSSVRSAYCTVQGHNKETVILKKRFRKAQTLLDTRIIHLLHHFCLAKPSSDKSVTRCVQYHTHTQFTCKTEHIKWKTEEL